MPVREWRVALWSTWRSMVCGVLWMSAYLSMLCGSLWLSACQSMMCGNMCMGAYYAYYVSVVNAFKRDCQ